MYDILKLLIDVVLIVLGILFLVLPLDILKKFKLVGENKTSEKPIKITGIICILAGILLFVLDKML